MEQALRAAVRTITALVILLVATVSLAAAENLYHGRDFVLGFLPGVDEPALPDVPDIELHLMSDVGATVTVEYPMGAPTFTRTVFVPPHSALVVGLPIAASRGWPAGVVRRNAVRVRTTDPPPARFAVLLVDRVLFSSDSALGLHADALGTDYVALMTDVDAAPLGKPSSELVVVARDPGTTVTIVPTADLLGGFPAGVPIVRTLAAGQGFLARANPILAMNGLAGTTVKADRPVAVTNGDFCTFVPPGVPACNHVFEVALPTRAWGRTIPVQSPPERPGGAIYRIAAAEDDTTVTLDGTAVATLDEGDFTTLTSVTGPHVIAADRPIFAMQFLTGSGGVLFGDPAITNMLPVEQYARGRTFATVGPDQFTRSWVTIIAESDDAAAGQVTLDGTAVPASDFTVVPTSAFSTAIIEVGPGIHRTESRGPHHVTVVGMNQWDAYLHPLAGRRSIDHYLCHRAGAGPTPASFGFADALGTGTATVNKTLAVCAPADKNAEGVRDPATHLVAYRVQSIMTPRPAVEVSDQFGSLVLDLRKTTRFLVPAAKTHPPALPPAAPDPASHEVDHYRCLDVRRTGGAPRFVPRSVPVVDQFISGQALVKKPARLCIPTDKNGEGIHNPDDVLLCYSVKVTPTQARGVVWTADQLHVLRQTIDPATELCVPATLMRGGCCEPRPERCFLAGVDTGPCDLPSRVLACWAQGGTCEGVSCDQRCGNGVLDPFCCEECDDGTRLDGDACSASCKVQPCCIPQPRRCQLDETVPCDEPIDCERAGVGGLCVTISCESRCGNGEVEPFCCEPCDDGNDCELPCQLEECVPRPCHCLGNEEIACDEDADCGGNGPCACFTCDNRCGNGEIEGWCCEECDAGSPLGNEECSPDCREVACNPLPCRCTEDLDIPCEDDSACPSGGCVCFDCGSRCGNGVVEPWCCEDCDDGTRLHGDNCSATCKWQPCCVPQPTRCAGDRSIPCDDSADCDATGVGPCISVSCDLACGDGLLQNFCCEQCDAGGTCYGYFPEGLAGTSN